MQIVADHLKAYALNAPNAVERDLFGRSAYNRYYYAAFLIVREGFRRMGEIGDGDDLPHANVSERLRNRLKKKFKSSGAKALKFPDHALAQKCSNAAVAAGNLGDLMDTARATRTVADYFPERPVEVSARGFSLMNVDIDEAKSWPVRAAAFMQTIESVWRQI